MNKLLVILVLISLATIPFIISSEVTPQGNFNMRNIYNISNIPLINFQDGTNLSSAVSVTGSNLSATSGPYLYDDTVTIYFNETVLNNTIGGLGLLLGFNSSYTNDTYINVSGLNISLFPSASQWLYNQSNLTWAYNQTENKFYYNQTDTVFFYNQTVLYTNSSYLNLTGTAFGISPSATQWFYNQTDVTKAYVNTETYSNWTDLRTYVSTSINANLTSFYSLNSTFWYNQTIGANTYTDSQLTSYVQSGLNDSWYIKYQNITNLPTCSGTDKLSYNGTDLVCSSDATGAGGKTTNGFYLYNDSASIFFNETQLNTTIEGLGLLLGFNTSVSLVNDSYINLSGTNIGLFPSASQWLYNQTDTIFFYNQTVLYTNGSYLNLTGNTFALSPDATQWLYNQTVIQDLSSYATISYVNTGANSNWTDLRSFVSTSINANLTNFYDLNSTYWFNETSDVLSGNNVYSGTSTHNNLVNISGFNNLTQGGAKIYWNGSCLVTQGLTSRIEVC